MPRTSHHVDPQDISDNVSSRFSDLEEREIAKIFAMRLNDEMHSKKISQTKMQEWLDMSSGVISNYRRGLNVPDIVTLRKIADHLEVTADYLVGKEDAPKRKYEAYTDLTGLSQTAVALLSSLCNSPRTHDTMNRLLSSFHFADMVEHIDIYINYILPEDKHIDIEKYIQLSDAVQQMTGGQLRVIKSSLEKQTTMFQTIMLLTKMMEEIDSEKGIDGSRMTIEEAHKRDFENEKQKQRKEDLIQEQKKRKRNPAPTRATMHPLIKKDKDGENNAET